MSVIGDSKSNYVGHIQM